MSNETEKQTVVALQPAVAEPRPLGVFESAHSFTHSQRVAKMLATSQLMPESFRGEENLGSVVIVMDIAMRLKLNPLMVAQQIYIIHGKPSFSSQFMIAVCNTNANFGKIRYDLRSNGEKEMRSGSGTIKIEDRVCVAWALEGEDFLPEGVNTLAKAKEKGLAILEGPPVSIEMAVKEGWYSKAGSKWQTLPDLMLRYRAAGFFVRLYGPELLMGLPTVDELEDLGPPEATFAKPIFGTPSSSTTPEVVAALPAPEAKAVQTTIDLPPHPSGGEPISQNRPPESEPVGVTKQIRELCEKENLKIENVLDFLIAIGSVKEETSSLEQVHLNHPNVLAMVVNQWPDIAKRIKESK